jgi:hypothetical protein
MFCTNLVISTSLRLVSAVISTVQTEDTIS